MKFFDKLKKFFSVTEDGKEETIEDNIETKNGGKENEKTRSI